MLENDVKDTLNHYGFEGIYTYQGFSGGMDYWIDAEGEIVLWYRQVWRFAPLAYLGSYTAAIKSVPGKLEKECPNNEGYVWNWVYSDGGSYITTNDVYIKCANEDDFCTSENPCGKDEGDCDIDEDCQNGLLCGSNNCPASLGVDLEMDCCYPKNGTDLLCDNSDECQTGLRCGSRFSNGCPAYVGLLASNYKCCTLC